MVVLTQRREVDIKETLYTRFYFGRERYYQLRAFEKEDGVFPDAFLSVFLASWGSATVQDG